jgi:toxin FitB
MNVDAARMLGRMYETPALRHFIVTDRQARRQATGTDLAISAIAIVNNGIVATTNIRHFLQINEHFRLPGLFDPIAQAWHLRRT